MAKIFKSRSVVLDDEWLAVDNRMPVIDVSPAFEDKTGLGLKPFDITVEEALSEQERILKEANEEAAGITARANKEAEEILASAGVERETLKRKMLDEARTNGYSDGFGKGKAEADALIAQANGLKAAAARELEDARAERAEMIAAIEPDMVGLIVKLTKTVIGGSMKLHPEAVAHIIRAGLAEANTADGVKVRICPEDWEDTEALRKALAGAVDSGAKLDIVKDPALSAHDVMVETAFGAIDCSLDVQLEMIVDNIYLLLNAES